MKKLNRSFLKKSNSLLFALLALLGFTTCNYYNNKQLDMYGTPMPDFAVKGKVTNVDDGKAIEGIRVSWNNTFAPEYGTLMPEFSEKSAVHSDKDGNYIKFFDITNQDIHLHFQDIDGEKNGAFRDTTVVVNFEAGKKVANIDIALTPKKSD